MYQPHEVKPDVGNVLLWRSVMLSGEEYVIDAVRAGFSAPLLYPGGSVRRIEPSDLVPPLTPNSVQAMDVARFARVFGAYLVTHPSHPLVIGDVRYAMLPDSTRPLWGIEIDPGASTACRIPYLRDFPRKDRQRFSRDAARPGAG